MESVLLQRLTSFVVSSGMPGLFVTMALEGAGLPIPSEVVLPFAGIMVSSKLLAFWPVVLWASLGQLAGALLTYGLGKYGGAFWVSGHGRLGKAALASAERWFDHHGELAVFVCRLLPGVRGVISVPAGFARMPWNRFLPYSLAGIIPWTVALVLAGAKFGELWRKAPGWSVAFRAAGLAGIVAVACFAVWQLLRLRSSS